MNKVFFPHIFHIYNNFLYSDLVDRRVGIFDLNGDIESFLKDSDKEYFKADYIQCITSNDSHIFVCDADSQGFSIFNKNGYFEKMRLFDLTFSNPYKIDLNKDKIFGIDAMHGQVFVSNYFSNEIYSKVKKFTSQEFSIPTNIKVKNNFVYVSDFSAIYVFSLSGKLIFKKSNLRHPGKIAVDDFNNCYFCECDKHIISKFDFNGKKVWEIGENISNDLKFNFPKDAEFYMGKLYISDCLNHQIKVLNCDGEFLKSFNLIY